MRLDLFEGLRSDPRYFPQLVYGGELSVFLTPRHDLARHHWTDPVNRLKLALICGVEIDRGFTGIRTRC